MRPSMHTCSCLACSPSSATPAHRAARRIRDIARKSAHDPLTSINSQLASRPTPSARLSRAPHPPQPHSRSGQTSLSSSVPNRSSSSNPSAERETRESAERLRVLELIRRKKREMEGSETPSNVHGGSAADEMSTSTLRHALDGSSTISDSDCSQFAYAPEALTTTPVLPQHTPAPSRPADPANNARARAAECSHASTRRPVFMDSRLHGVVAALFLQ